MREFCGTKVKNALLALVLSMMLHPATTLAEPSDDDPLETVNRAIFGFNTVVDGLILDPAQQIYGYVVPDPAKTGLRNLLDNLASPIIFLNDVLQGERERAGNTLARFLVNSSLGVGGLFDVASAFGLPKKHNEDFGQTLGSYGVGEGAYLVLPILGPSSLRDAAGRGVDMFMSPLGYVFDTELLTARTVLDGIDTRYQLDPVLDDLSANSIDLYAATRSVYRQKRESDILNGQAPTDDSEYEDIFSEDF